MKTFLKHAVCAVTMAYASSAGAATLIVDGNGQLTGAQGVDVGGTLYDVEFADGTCAAVFNGCNEESDFAFDNQAQALLAAQSLIDQVFIDGAQGAFDSNPSLTKGCGLASFCQLKIPYVILNSVQYGVAAANNNWNAANAAQDGVATTFNSNNFDTSTNVLTAFARFSAVSAVPEPSTWLMMILGFGAIGGAMRRQRKANVKICYA